MVREIPFQRVKFQNLHREIPSNPASRRVIFLQHHIYLPISVKMPPTPNYIGKPCSIFFLQVCSSWHLRVFIIYVTYKSLVSVGTSFQQPRVNPPGEGGNLFTLLGESTYVTVAWKVRGYFVGKWQFLPIITVM
jgi:hypothetical protein